jgi:hypothetical protein
LSSEKWYGDGSSWTEERIEAALSEAAFDPRIERKPRAVAVIPEGAKVKVGPPAAADKGRTLTALKPWEEAGVSRRTWYRRLGKAVPKGGG